MTITARDSTPVVPGPRASRAHRWFRAAERVLACVGLGFILFHLCLDGTIMTSGSMAPALTGTSPDQGDRILLEKVTGWFRQPKRWEIHFFYNEDGTPVTKRIVGMPGETISLKDNQIFINGKEIDRPAFLKHVNYLAIGKLANGRVVDCGRGYFVLGDDSRDSYDSRYTGVVSPESFCGRVWCIVSPASRFGFVK